MWRHGWLIVLPALFVFVLTFAVSLSWWWSALAGWLIMCAVALRVAWTSLQRHQDDSPYYPDATPPGSS